MFLWFVAIFVLHVSESFGLESDFHEPQVKIVKVPVPHPYPVEVIKKVPVQVPVPIPNYVPYPVEHEVPVFITREVPVVAAKRPDIVIDTPKYGDLSVKFEQGPTKVLTVNGGKADPGPFGGSIFEGSKVSAIKTYKKV